MRLVVALLAFTPLAWGQVGGLTALPTPAYTGNLLLNPGFETDGTPPDPANWTSNFDWARVTDVKRSGTASYHLHTAVLQDFAQHADQTVSIVAGTYKLSAYLKTNALGAGRALSGLKICMDNGSAWQSCSEVVSGTQDWTLLVADKVSVSADINAKITLYGYGAPDGEAWIDDIELVRETRPVSAYLLHPNYRGMLYSDESQTVTFNVAVEPPSGTLSDYHVLATITDVDTSTVVATPTFAAATSATRSIDFSSFTAGRRRFPGRTRLRSTKRPFSRIKSTGGRPTCTASQVFIQPLFRIL